MATYQDGSATAPAGTAEFPTLLSGYATRPAWEVAGVDYHVGTPTGEALKAPSTIAAAGVQVNATTHTVTVSGNNVTLDGYDFSGNGGWQVDVVNGATNLTVKNSYFKVGANNLIPVQAAYGGAVNLLNNTFDGGGAGRSVNAMFFAGKGATVEYNRFTNFEDDGIDITQNGNFAIKYNDFDTMGLGTAAHTDAIQTYFSAVNSLDVEYNTLYQPPNNGVTNSFIRIGDERGNTVNSPTMAYNTIVTKGTSQQGFANIFQLGADDGTAGSRLLNPTVHDNYIDPTGTMYAVVSPELSSATNPNVYNNVNMTGSPSKQLLVGPNNSWSSGVPSAAPKTPTIAADRITSGTQHALSGTAPSGTTVDVFNANTLLGSTKAGSNGTWSFTTAALGAGTPAFSANATDQYGNTSARSAVFGAATTGSSGTGTGTAPTSGGGSTGVGAGSGTTPTKGTETLFPASTKPTLAADPDPNPVELGVKFSSATAGTVTGVSYYKSAADTGTHTGTLFSSTGTVLATGTFTNETASGWQTLTFSKPVSIAAGATYVAAFHSNGHYATTVGGFTTAHTSGNLTAPVNAGVYGYGASGTVPTHTYEATNYDVSVQFVPKTSAAAVPVTQSKVSVAAPAATSVHASGTDTASGLSPKAASDHATSAGAVSGAADPAKATPPASGAFAHTDQSGSPVLLHHAGGFHSAGGGQHSAASALTQAAPIGQAQGHAGATSAASPDGFGQADLALAHTGSHFHLANDNTAHGLVALHG